MQDDSSEIFDHGLFKLTLVCSKVELVLLQEFQDSTSDPSVLLKGLCENEDIIHHCLESGHAISKTKRHDERFKEAFHSSPSLMQTLLNSHQMSNLVKYFACQSFAISSGMSGSGYLFFMV